MDNLSPHKSDPTLALITQRERPRYFSCRPIRRTSIPLKRCGVRSKACCGRQRPGRQRDLITAIGQALAKVTSQDALGWFVSCGYSFC